MPRLELSMGGGIKWPGDFLAHLMSQGLNVGIPESTYFVFLYVASIEAIKMNRENFSARS
jgi:hypothetical protein